MSKIIVIKIGTATITDDNGKIDVGVMYQTAHQIKQLKKRGYRIIMVSSGAIGSGIDILELKETPAPADLSLKQVCAAVGQVKLMKRWQRAFGEVLISQHLVTHSIFKNGGNLEDFSNCLSKALDMGLVPIINENDPVSTNEIDENFTDNDELAVKIALSVKADKMIILSDVSGLYTDNPQNNPEAELIEEVRQINSDMFKLARGKSKLGRGGMIGKLEAIGDAMEAGIEVYLTFGKADDAVLSVFDGTFTGTKFLP